ncbi:MAG: hypothetical protein KC416_16080, partial [Myxococcales bacterium]|nr:hypothetical protein [Myxococcales bacterium]
TVAHVVLDDLPWAEILTSDTCYTADNEPRACDTGAPYTAGVLTTRAFMVSRVGRFNLTRASTLMGVFACRKYPMEDDLQPRIDRARLIEMFRADNAEEQAEERAKAGFGNGAECYTCHGQFSLHAQPFVRFDKEGVWHQDATGLQSEAETAQLGESDNGLFTSHLEDPAEAASERTQFFGKEVENLVGVATELSASDAFGRCSVENVLGYVFNLDEGVSVAPEVTEDALQRARNRHYDFTFADLMVSTLSHPSVVFTTLDYFGDGT